MRKYALRDFFEYIDNSKIIIDKFIEKRMKSLGRLEGSTDEELQDMSMYNH